MGLIIAWIGQLALLAYGLGPVELVDEKFDYDQAHPAAGVWLGNVSGPKESWSIGQLVIQRDEGWAVTAFIPSLDAYHAAGAEVAVEAGSITFKLGSEGEPWRIHASVSDDGQRMIGTISTEHGEAAGTLELARTLRPADLPDPMRFAGEISTPNTGALEISITLARTPGGNWVGALDFPAGGLTGLPLYNISGGDDGLRAEVPLRRGGVIEATFDENHERLTGTLKQGFFEFALELTRGAADTPRPRADPASAFGRWAEASWMIRRHVGPRWVLAGGNVIDVRTGQVQMGANIVISGDIIESVSDEPVADDMHVVDITGRYVIPGLFDLHAHVQPFDRGATPDSSEAAEIFETLLDHGVTVVRALPLYSEFALALAARVNDGSLIGPSVVAASGVLELEPQRTSWGFGDPETARRWVAKEAFLGTRWIKVYNAMDEPSLRAIVEEAHRRGMRVCGHTEGVPPREASLIGFDCIEHMVSIPLSCLPDGSEPPSGSGLAAKIAWRWSQADEQELASLMELFVANGTAWVPTLVVIEKMLHRGGHDGRSDLAPGDTARLEAAIRKSAALAVSLHRGGGLVGLGTDFPVDGVEPGESVHRELEILVEQGGATPLEALQIGTIASAQILELDGIVGCVASGKVANLVVLGGNPLERIAATRSIELVVHDGRLHRPGSTPASD